MTNNLLVSYTAMIGREYRQLDDNGLYEGCMFPLFYTFPKMKEMAQAIIGDAIDSENKIQRLLKSFMDPIDPKDIKPGDIVLIQHLNLTHVALYVGNYRLVHCSTAHSLMFSKYRFDDKRIGGVYRIKEEYR